ncbi:glycosyltransferase family 2 protein [Pectobacterium carotovorum]|uniref:glycosyltransferase family 2 protein n=1 Tax=Pectobacterium carotovorum TaxID=554 RepID=UPI000691FD02|nr:glycosyltransferase family 2 protein [Pectobacterium carotovorum]MBA0192250.1 glycosyltransferase family 2 protein [Pectobacterium carotovorum]MBA0199537.1 glycosyltransferase family 2 protein [Pectobacterium carotovorum]
MIANLNTLPEISIVLATYNGEKYIHEQLNSILNSNEFSKLVKEIVITDDGSTDNTQKILDKYIVDFNRIRCVKNSKEHKGVIGNFLNGINNCSGKYIMLSDQDDVWLPNKIKESYECIINVETDKRVPTIVFSDLKIVDSSLNIKAESFFSFFKVNPDESINIRKLVLNNIAPGCTCIFNRELLKYSVPFPNNIIMHDWWLLLVASVVGRVSIIKKPLILYRQHESNVIGAKSEKFKDKIINIISIARTYKIQKERKKLQAENLLQLKIFFKNKDTENIIHSFSNNVFFPTMWENSFFRRLLSIFSLIF